MITIRKSEERRHVRRGEHDIRSTFPFQESPDSCHRHFGNLVGLDEIRLFPNGVLAVKPRGDVETITYMFRGALAQDDLNGNRRTLFSGEFQRMIIGGGLGYKEKNALRMDPSHIFRISLGPTEAGLNSSFEQKRFAVGQRRNLLCAIASRDGRKGSFGIIQDTFIFSSILDSGYHLVHELSPGRSAWLHVINGEVTLEGMILNEGDGAGFSEETSVSFTARENAEILLIDLGSQPKQFAWRVAPGRDDPSIPHSRGNLSRASPKKVFPVVRNFFGRNVKVKN